MSRSHNLLKELEWYVSMGVDEVVGDFAPIEMSAPVIQTRQDLEKAAGLQEAPADYKPSPAQTIKEPKPVADTDLASIKTLEELRAYMDTFDGCDLRYGAKQMVFSDGVPGSKVMVIGEAPGAEEDKLGKPFVGRSGQLLDLVLGSIGLSRQKNVYIGNIVPWRPPNNRAPTDKEIAVCLPLIEKHISLINPAVIILAGGTAVKALLQTKLGINRLRGQMAQHTNRFMDNPIPVLPTFHPAFLLRSPGQKRLVWQDMLLLKKTLTEAGIKLD